MVLPTRRAMASFRTSSSGRPWHGMVLLSLSRPSEAETFGKRQQAWQWLSFLDQISFPSPLHALSQRVERVVSDRANESTGKWKVLR